MKNLLLQLTILLFAIFAGSPSASAREHYEKGFKISGLESFEGKDDYFVFHAGTKLEGEDVLTNGGRVLGVTAIGNNLKEAIEIYQKRNRKFGAK